MATFRFYVPSEVILPSPSVKCKEDAGQFYFDFHNIDELEPFPTLSRIFCESIVAHATQVTALLNNEGWLVNTYKEDGVRYSNGEANCTIRFWKSYHGHADITIQEHVKVLVTGPTLQSVLELIFAMKRGEATKVGDPTFAEYAKQRGIPYSALKKNWKQRLQDWWKKVRIDFLNLVKPRPIPREVVND